MGYHFRLYNGQHPNPGTTVVNGVGWNNTWDSVKSLPMFSDWSEGFIYKGGVWILHQGTATTYDTYIGFSPNPPYNSSTSWLSGSHQIINDTTLSQRGITVNGAYRLEWRVEKINETQARVEYYINGGLVGNTLLAVGDSGSAYFKIRTNTATTRCREYYECENDEPFLQYWEFRRVPFIAKPSQAITSAQLNNGSFNFTQTTEVEAELDTRDIPDDQTVLGVVFEGNMRWRRRSPRHFTHCKFVLEGQHLDYQQEFPEAAANVTNYTAVTPINDSIQPRLLPQLDTNVKLRWEMEVEE